MPQIEPLRAKKRHFRPKNALIDLSIRSYIVFSWVAMTSQILGENHQKVPVFSEKQHFFAKSAKNLKKLSRRKKHQVLQFSSKWPNFLYTRSLMYLPQSFVVLLG